jgi:hypothetical protein
VNTNPLNGAALNTAPRSAVQRSAVSLQGVASINVQGHVRAFSPLSLTAQASMVIIGRRRTHGAAVALTGQASITFKGKQNLRSPLTLTSAADIALRTKIRRRGPLTLSAQATIVATGHSVYTPSFDKAAPSDRIMVVLVDNRTMTERL